MLWVFWCSQHISYFSQQMLRFLACLHQTVIPKKLKTRVLTFICLNPHINYCIPKTNDYLLSSSSSSSQKSLQKPTKISAKISLSSSPRLLLCSSLQFRSSSSKPHDCYCTCSSITTHCTNFLFHLCLCSSTHHCCFSLKKPTKLGLSLFFFKV